MALPSVLVTDTNRLSVHGVLWLLDEMVHLTNHEGRTAPVLNRRGCFVSHSAFRDAGGSSYMPVSFTIPLPK
jgi:hypothetical protein